MNNSKTQEKIVFQPVFMDQEPWIMEAEELKGITAYQNEWHRLRVNLLFSTNWLIGEIKTFIEPFGITQKQFNILRILRGNHPDEVGLTIHDIRERMIDKMSDASRLVDRLSKKGLILKKPCTKDKRHARVRISQDGLDLLEQIDAQIPRLDQVFKGLNEEEATQLNNLLNKMRD